MGQDMVAVSTKSCLRGLCNIKTGWLRVLGIMGVRETADSPNKVRGRGCCQLSSSHWGEILLLDFSGFSIFGATVGAPDTCPRHLKLTPTKGISPSFCPHQHSHPPVTVSPYSISPCCYHASHLLLWALELSLITSASSRGLSFFDPSRGSAIPSLQCLTRQLSEN